MNTTYLKTLKTPIAVFGLGRSGLSALNLLKEFGYTTDQLLTYDENNKSAQFNKPEQILALYPQTLIVSPGFPLNNPVVKKLIIDGAHLTSEISLAASLLTHEKIIGVTGSVGKSTVVSLLEAGLKSFDSTAFVGGNIGTPLCDYILKSKKKGTTANWVVLELSSYQLENCAQLKLDYSIITYLSPNHLERYESLDHYYQTKLHITSITKELCLLSKTSKDCEKYAPQSKSKFKLVNADNFSHPELIPHVYLLGLHNKDNFSLAAEMARICNWPVDSFTEMTNYRGLPHRLEFVAKLDGITYVNDSKATAMDSVLVAVKGCLENISSENKLFLLLGGKDKNHPWNELSILSSNNQITPLFFGACGLVAKEKANLVGHYFERLGSAINFCQKNAKTGDVILLSPGGTSLDEFKSFEERGDYFKSLVLSGVEA